MSEVAIKEERGEINLHDSLAESLGLSAEGIDLHNPETFLAGKKRFLFGFVDRGFLKASRNEDKGNTELARESAVTQALPSLGIPAVQVLKSSQETSWGGQVILLERIYSESGTFFPGIEFVKSANPQFGRQAAQLIMATTGTKIPPKVDTTLFKRDIRNSPEKFWEEIWQNDREVVLDSLPEGNGLVHRDSLATIIDEVEAEIRPMIAAATSPDNLYLVHNDASLTNMFFPDQGESMMIDWTDGGVTNNRILAFITDLGNCYGRCWSNPELQQKFLLSILQEKPLETLQENYKLARAAAVFGTIYLAKFAMDPQHPENKMARGLLSSLEDNLDVLKSEYDRHRGL